MSPDVGQLLGGGALAIIIIREVLTFVKSWGKPEGKLEVKPTNGSAGAKPPEYWEMTFRRIFESCLDDKLRPVQECLVEIRQNQRQTINALRRARVIKDPDDE